MEKISNQKTPELKNIEIETINRCNGLCAFCPVNRNLDKRDLKKMDDNLFFDIINQLHDMDYCGSIGLYSNNEPLLDKRLEKFAEYARIKLPNAVLYIDTNGTLLNQERFERLMRSLDYMIIDNYSDDLQYIPQINSLLPIIESKEYSSRVYVCLRKQNELLNNRGGISENRTKSIFKMKSGCVFPFEQMVIRPDGKISLCCNDATGELTLGDLNENTISEIWENEAFSMIRTKMLNGRQNITKCQSCDTLVPYVYAATPMVKGTFKTMILGYKYKDR